jgi:DNA-3-methyladenine glycosylase I
LNNQLYIDYHDKEWGVPVHDDRKLFEFIVLESAQAGLSWEIILKKREGYRKAFKQFDPKKVAKMTEKDVERLLGDASIVRNRHKIAATVNNAKRFLEVQKEFGSFSEYMWGWVEVKKVNGGVREAGLGHCEAREGGLGQKGQGERRSSRRWPGPKPVHNKRKSPKEIPALTPLSVGMSKDLKKRGFKFLGPTIWYAHMQAVGMVNDHTRDCFRYGKCTVGK